jgi:DNA-binding NarL/FixJ family response regulator
MTRIETTKPSDGGTPARPRVLLVDDNAAMLDRAAMILAGTCTIVGTAREGRSAIAAAAELTPDVIVLDISMPGMNGFEVAAALRHAGSTAAVVFLTVHQEDDFFSVARGAGGLGYVIKPRLVTDLVEAVLSVNDGRPYASPKS